MARLFDDGVPHHITVASAVLSAVPISMAAWFNSDDITLEQTLLAISDLAGAVNYFSLRLGGSTAGDPIRALTFDGGFAEAKTSTGYSANAWHHATGVWAANDDRRAYIDGGSKGTDVNSITPAGLDQTDIGSLERSTGRSSNMSGLVAEAAMWNVALSDAEAAALAEGYSPLLVHPQNLVFYVPLVREILDVVGGVTLTNTGSTVGDHCRVLYPPPPSLAVLPGVAVTTRRYSLPLVGVG